MSWCPYKGWKGQNLVNDELMNMENAPGENNNALDENNYVDMLQENMLNNPQGE